MSRYKVLNSGRTVDGLPARAVLEAEALPGEVSSAAESWREAVEALAEPTTLCATRSASRGDRSFGSEARLRAGGLRFARGPARRLTREGCGAAFIVGGYGARRRPGGARRRAGARSVRGWRSRHTRRRGRGARPERGLALASASLPLSARIPWWTTKSCRVAGSVNSGEGPLVDLDRVDVAAWRRLLARSGGVRLRRARLPASRGEPLDDSPDVRAPGVGARCERLDDPRGSLEGDV